MYAEFECWACHETKLKFCIVNFPKIAEFVDCLLLMNNIESSPHQEIAKFSIKFSNNQLLFILIYKENILWEGKLPVFILNFHWAFNFPNSHFPIANRNFQFRKNLQLNSKLSTASVLVKCSYSLVLCAFSPVKWSQHINFFIVKKRKHWIYC